MSTEKDSQGEGCIPDSHLGFVFSTRVVLCAGVAVKVCVNVKKKEKRMPGHL